MPPRSSIAEFSPFPDLPAEVRMIVPFGGSFQSDRSKIEEFKAFEDNIIVKSMMTYTTDKEGPLTTIEARNIIILPETPMVPRYADERIGFFEESRKLFDEHHDRLQQYGIINRWDLQPKDMDKYLAGELVEPVKPIVWYVDPAIPEKWRKYVKLGIADWNIAFEAIGFKNAIVVKDYPVDDPNFDPDDIHYNCYRFVTSAKENSMGPSWIDPRSGEIIQADILWYHNVVRLLQEWRFIQTAAADPRARNKELSEEIMGELIRYAVAHETGHTLGMKHNMRASFAYPVDSLRSPSFTRKYGTTASIMDYARNNYVAQPGDFERGVKMTPPILGPFDYFSVQWAYTPIFGVKTPEEELPVLDRMFREKGHDPLFLYANMAMGPVVPDPSGQSDMLGDDLLKSSTYGILNLRYIMSHLIDWCSDEGGSYDRMIEMYDAGVKQFFKYMNNCASYIGGVYYFPGTVGQYEARHVEVDKEQQKKAVHFIIDELQESEQWLCDRRLFGLIGNKTETLMNRQGEMLATLVSPNLLSRLIGSVYPIEEYLRDISTHLFPDKKSWSEYEKNRQIAYVLALKKINDEKGGPGKANDYLKRTAVHVEIVRLSKKLERQVKYSEHIGFIMDLLKR